MGSYLSRNLREAFEAAGCDGIAPLDASDDGMKHACSSAKDPHTQQTNPRPVTPVPHPRTRLLSLDPRSPSFGIVRTPIEVTATPDSNKPRKVKKVESDTSGAERHYLETDLDSFHDMKDNPCTPVTVSHKFPPGLSASHLLKLKFLEMDPRSPSEGIVRTPIQTLIPQGKQSSDESSKESMDTSSLNSSRSLFGSSNESVDISKACSEPSAIVSDYEQSKDWSLSMDINEPELEEVNLACTEEPEAEIEANKKKITEDLSDQSCESGESISSSENYDEKNLKRDEELAKEICLLAEKISQTPISSRPSSKVHIFSEGLTQTPQNTPKKKSTRTPLSLICNLTPSDVNSRGKKTQRKFLNKENLVCKILSGCENTPPKQISVLVKKGEKSVVDENAKLGEWDQDTTIII